MTQQPSEQTIFLHAIGLPAAADRAAYLDEVCRDNPRLRAELDALLAAHHRLGGGRPGIPDRGRRAEASARASRGPASLPTPTPTVPPECDAASDGGMGPIEWPEEEEPLDFLASSQRPGSLGRLGHYEVFEVVGKGGMGIVLRAFDDKLHRVVAIKVLLPALASSGPARQRFVREARAAAAVTHDNVIAIYAVEDAGPVPFLVMQFIAGRTLQEKLDRTGPLPVKEVLRIGLQIAAGLAAAHAQGLVHRDVKPANILLENSVERVKITDFGLARTVDDASLTGSGLIAGTPAYMSPEQVHGKKVDHRSDLFSLGSVLYTICAGHAPFRADTAMAVLKRVCEDTPRPLHEVNPDVPDWLEALIARLHAKAPADRFQTAAEVADLLGRHLAHLQQPGMKPPEPPTPVAEPRDPSGARRSGVSGTRPTATTGHSPGRWAAYSARRLAACAALIGVGCVALYWIFWRPHDAKTPDTPNDAAQEAPPWKPRPPLTLEELAKLPSPLDSLKREAMKLPEDAPPELLAVLGDPARFSLSGQGGCGWMAQTGDGRLLAVPCGTNIRLFEARTGRLLRTLPLHTSQTLRPAFSPDGKRLAAGSGGILRVWDVTTGREELRLTDHKDPVCSVVFDAEGKRLVSGGLRGTVKVRDAEGRVITTLEGHKQVVKQLAFSPDGKRLATPSFEGTCKVWDTDTWKEIRSLPAHGKTFDAVAWSRDGKLLAAGDDDQVILWNADTYDELHTLPTPGLGMVAFTPDGRTLLTARLDCTNGQRHAWTRWDVKTGTVHPPPSGPPPPATTPFSTSAQTAGRCLSLTYTRKLGSGPTTPRRARNGFRAVTPARCRAWRSAPTAAPSPPAAPTKPCASGTSPAGGPASRRRPLASWRATPTRCGRSRSARTASSWPPAATTA
jgi:serine/threonine protein kinase